MSRDMSSSDDSVSVYFLLKEVHRLGINRKSADYKILIRAIRNLFSSNSPLDPAESFDDPVVPFPAIKSEAKNPGEVQIEVVDIVRKEPRTSSHSGHSSDSASQARGSGKENHDRGYTYYSPSEARPSYNTDEGRDHKRARKSEGVRHTCDWPGCKNILVRGDEESIKKHYLAHVLGNSSSRSNVPPLDHPSTAGNHRSSSAKGETSDRYKCSRGGKAAAGSDMGEDPYADWNGEYSSTTPQIAQTWDPVGERPFICTWDNCGKTFARPYNLARHRWIHTGASPFKCTWEGCGKSFQSSCELNKHRKLHTEPADS